MTAQRRRDRKLPPPPPVTHDIPIPPHLLTNPRRNNGSSCRWPWADCAVGGSFFAAGYGTCPGGKEPVMQPRGGAAVVPGSRWLCESRVENGVDGVRVWRIA